MQNRPPHRLRVAAAAVALTILAVGCGDDDDDTLDGAIDEAPEVVDDVEPTVEAAASELGAVLDDLGLTSLATAVEGLDLERLIPYDEYTFFAPSDDAFASLSADGITDLLADPELLIETLENHLVEGRLDAAALSGVGEVTTAYGSTVPVRSNDGVQIGEANVTTADVSVGDDGVIHVVDALLIPGE